MKGTFGTTSIKVIVINSMICYYTIILVPLKLTYYNIINIPKYGIRTAIIRKVQLILFLSLLSEIDKVIAFLFVY